MPSIKSWKLNSILIETHIHTLDLYRVEETVD